MEVSDFCMLNKQFAAVENPISESNLFLMLIYSGNNVNHSLTYLIAIIGNTGQHDFRGLPNIS
ncbi:hypothetical protein T02_9326 [Trichinella nativa]|uniref:Uncharacterized protein n=1 Tax=Trichinella nativa TaxID=6335 RepID=A0A0V1LK41_9BILA|nr:hypothetical protein T02_9326 [Trichinella nativa]